MSPCSRVMGFSLISCPGYSFMRRSSWAFFSSGVAEAGTISTSFSPATSMTLSGFHM